MIGAVQPYNETMLHPTSFDWRDDNAAVHVAEHGVPFAIAAAVFADPRRIETEDSRSDGYGERRWNIIGLVDGIHLNVFPLVPANELVSDIGHDQELTAVQPVFVGRDGRAETVVISMEEYGRWQRCTRHAFAAGQLPEGLLEVVARVEMDERHAHLDKLLENGRAHPADRLQRRAE